MQCCRSRPESGFLGGAEAVLLSGSYSFSNVNIIFTGPLDFLKILKDDGEDYEDKDDGEDDEDKDDGEEEDEEE